MTATGYIIAPDIIGGKTALRSFKSAESMLTCAWHAYAHHLSANQANQVSDTLVKRDWYELCVFYEWHHESK